MAQVKPKKDKNIVTVGRLKEIVGKNKRRIGEIEYLRKMTDYDAMDMNPADIDEQKELSLLSMQNARYEKMIANPKAYKPKKK